jgi:hypothetical protein
LKECREDSKFPSFPAIDLNDLRDYYYLSLNRTSYFCKTDGDGYLSLKDYSLDNMEVENVLAKQMFAADAAGNKITSGIGVTPGDAADAAKGFAELPLSSKDLTVKFRIRKNAPPIPNAPPIAQGPPGSTSSEPANFTSYNFTLSEFIYSEITYNYTFSDICDKTASRNYDFIVASTNEYSKTWYTAPLTLWKDLVTYGEGAVKEEAAVKGRRLVRVSYNGPNCDDAEINDIQSLKLSDKAKTSFCSTLPSGLPFRFGGSVEIVGDSVVLEDFELPGINGIIDDIASRFNGSKEELQRQWQSLPSQSFPLNVCQESLGRRSGKFYITTKSVKDIRAANSAAAAGMSIAALITGALAAIF